MHAHLDGVTKHQSPIAAGGDPLHFKTLLVQIHKHRLTLGYNRDALGVDGRGGAAQKSKRRRYTVDIYARHTNKRKVPPRKLPASRKKNRMLCAPPKFILMPQTWRFYSTVLAFDAYHSKEWASRPDPLQTNGKAEQSPEKSRISFELGLRQPLDNAGLQTNGTRTQVRHNPFAVGNSNIRIASTAYTVNTTVNSRSALYTTHYLLWLGGIVGTSGPHHDSELSELKTLPGSWEGIVRPSFLLSRFLSWRIHYCATNTEWVFLRRTPAWSILVHTAVRHQNATLQK